ncbi:MAG: WD40 repeat domain-containing protein [Phycisphaerales bacterium]
MRNIIVLGILFLVTVTNAYSFVLPKIKNCRKLETKIDIKQGGLIVIPDTPEFLSLGDYLKINIENICGTKFEVSTDFDHKIRKDQNIIAVGSMMNNMLMERLYWNYYIFSDPACLGKNGIIIETAYQPLPILPHNNVISIAAANVQTAKKAVDEFLSILRNSCCIEKPILIVKNIEPHLENVAYFQKMKKLRGFRGMTDWYHLTGNEAYLREAMKMLDEQVEAASKNNDWVLVWPDETDSFRAICAWDWIQEHLDLSQDEMLKYEQFFLNINYKLVNRTEIFDDIKPGSVLTWNHTALPLLGMYTSARYFKAHYGFKVLNEILHKAQWYFMGQAENYRVSCDAFTYAVLSVRSPLAYYAMTGQLKYFENGNAKKMLYYLLAQLDNNGRAGGCGDVHNYECISNDLTFDILDWKLMSPELLWFRTPLKNDYETIWFGIEKKTSSEINSKFYPDLKPENPKCLEGCVSIDFDKGMYDHLEKQKPFRMLQQSSLPKLKPNIPYNQAFDKLQFRSIEPDGGEYLLVEGFGQGNHGHLDTGSIVCGTFQGRRFLYDSDYLVNNSNEHSMITVVKNGISPLPVPPCAALIDNFNFNKGAYACTRVKNYNGINWDRHILWFKNQYFIVVDNVEACEQGDFNIDCVWKVVKQGTENFDGRDLTCYTENPPDSENKKQLVFHLKGLTQGWINERTSEDKVKSLLVHQTNNLEMKTGDSFAYKNIFYLERKDDSGAVKNYTPIEISSNVMKIASTSDSYVINGKFKNETFSTDSKFSFLSKTEALLVNVKSFIINDNIKLSSTKPIICWFKDDNLIIQAKENGDVKLYTNNCNDTLNYKKGTTSYKLARPFSIPINFNGNKTSPALKSAEAQNLINEYKPIWKSGYAEDMHNAADISIGDINNDGINEIVLAASRKVVCYGLDGKKIWQFENSDEFHSCEIVSGFKDNIKVIAGTNKASLYCLDNNGKFICSPNINLMQSGLHGFPGKPLITHLVSKDINNDGTPELIVGTRAWQIHILNANLEPLWYNSMVLHGVSDLMFGSTLNGITQIYVGDLYGGLYKFDFTKDSKDTLNRKVFVGIGSTYITALDINNDGVDDIIGTSSCGRMSAYDGAKIVEAKYIESQMELKKLWTLNDYGNGYSCIKLMPDKNSTLVASSESGHILLIDPFAGKLLNALYTGHPIREVLVHNDKYLIASSELGYIWVIDSKNKKIIKTAKIDQKVIKIKSINEKYFACLGENGEVSVFEIPVE